MQINLLLHISIYQSISIKPSGIFKIFLYSTCLNLINVFVLLSYIIITDQENLLNCSLLGTICPVYSYQRQSREVDTSRFDGYASFFSFFLVKFYKLNYPMLFIIHYKNTNLVLTNLCWHQNVHIISFFVAVFILKNVSKRFSDSFF